MTEREPAWKQWKEIARGSAANSPKEEPPLEKKYVVMTESEKKTTTEPVFTGDGYSIVAWARGEEILSYIQFGSYQGEWTLFARRPADRTYVIYKGSYGSCSGCDDFEAELSDHSRTNEEDGQRGVPMSQAKPFADKYPPFIEIPRDTAAMLAKDREFASVLPRHFNDRYSDIRVDDLIIDWTLIVCLDENQPVIVSDVFNARNLELRRRVLDRVGVETFMAATPHDVIDQQPGTEDYLIGFMRTRIETDRGNKKREVADEWRMLWLKDSSTPRRYLLRVPNAMRTVLEAKAWTFNLHPGQYTPVVET